MTPYFEEPSFEEIIRTWPIEEGSIASEWVEKGRAEGLKVGRALGLEEGFKLGLEEGKDIGIWRLIQHGLPFAEITLVIDVPPARVRSVARRLVLPDKDSA